ncbi:hypothetical protein HPB50_000818 [Hyalomma asiaticum]|uniref:Uncharacterized protein n=1 Tax=Hyalomma asiaticum TaxID=266040 RepID=A0ACB7SJB3_HYAAI|nr:hypothetical protein HPB50_000818 [Hyalomma asiaticum]
MARPKPPLSIPKYKGTPEGVPIDKWLQLFDMKESKALWTHRDRLKGGQTIKKYYEKKKLGSLAGLKKCHIISGLTDGVPPDVELVLTGLSLQASSEWLATAQLVETSLRRYYIKSSMSLQQTAAANINISAASSAMRM